MWSDLPLTWSSKTLIALIITGFVLLASGFVGAMIADRPEPPGTYDPMQSYEKALVGHMAVTVAGTGGIVAVAGMVLAGITARELNPQVRRGLLVGAGILMIGIALLFMPPSPYWI